MLEIDVGTAKKTKTQPAAASPKPPATQATPAQGKQPQSTQQRSSGSTAQQQPQAHAALAATQPTPAIAPPAGTGHGLVDPGSNALPGAPAPSTPPPPPSPPPTAGGGQPTTTSIPSGTPAGKYPGRGAVDEGSNALPGQPPPPPPPPPPAAPPPPTSGTPSPTTPTTPSSHPTHQTGHGQVDVETNSAPNQPLPPPPPPPAPPPTGGGTAGTTNAPNQADPNATHPGTRPPAPGSPPRGVPHGWESSAAKNTAESAYRFFLGKHLLPVQAAALVGNFLVESGYGLNPRADNHIGNHGIAQWGTSKASGERWQTLQSWAAKQKRSIYNIQTQLDFVWYELTTDYSSALSVVKVYSNPNDINTVSDIITRSYEGAVNNDGSLQAPLQREYESRLVQYTFF